MNYQQWQPLAAAPVGRRVTVNTGGYIIRGEFYRRPNDDLHCVGPYGKIYEAAEIETWSWSDTEPEAEMLMVKPHGIFCAHWWNEIGHILNIIATHDIKLFVEIGVLDGGLAALMIDRVSYIRDFWYIGIDLPEHLKTYLDPRVGSACLHGRKLMLGADAWDEKTVAWVAEKNAGGRAMIYCDGGNKIKEAHLYWPILRPGDLLGVHDYSDDSTAKGPEVYYPDVSDIIRAGKRLGQDDLKDTRILLVEKV